MDPLQILSRLGEDNPNPPSDSELSSAADAIREALDEATSAETPDLELAKDLRQALDTVRTEIDAREQAAEANREEARKLREGIFDEETETSEDESDPQDDESSEEGDQPGPALVEEPAPVAASTTDLLSRIRRHVNRVAPQEESPRIVNGITVKPIGPAAGFELDQADFGELGGLFSTHAKSAGRTEQRLVRIQKDYPEDHRLGFNVDQNNKKMADIFGYGATSRPITASGGLCGPGDVDHSHPVCAEAGRPVRDSLVQFNASRGQLTFHPAMGLGDLDAAVSIWTAETDADPGTATKPCPPIECPEELSCAVDAVTRCITVGNFQAQFSPEYWAASLELLMATFDRAAEQKMLEEMYAASTNLGVLDYGNVIASLLSGINSTVAADRSTQRRITGTYTMVADAFLRDYMRNQVIANLGVANNVETIQLADATINGWLADAGVSNVVWTYDGTFDGTDHRVLAPGQVATDAGVLLYPDDAFIFLDGGTIDLGTSITDSALNATNDRQAFAESFEKVCFRGCSAYVFTVPVDTACGCVPVGS